MASKRIFTFGLQKGALDTGLLKPDQVKSLLGGKGASLVDMHQLNMPVPPGFTITTDQCLEYRQLLADDTKRVAFMDALMVEVMEHLTLLEDHFGYLPLLSVRSGAPVSMPGMMDTILNVGLNSLNLHEWKHRLGDRAVYDSQRRLIQMLGCTAYGMNHDVFEFQLGKVKKLAKVEQDKDLDVHQMEQVVDNFRFAFEKAMGVTFPDGLHEQLENAIEAVFRSWDNERAVEYRNINGISHHMGTAVTVQAMVFGNLGETSGSGVLFSRDPSTGDQVILAEYLANAQGEDVVAGIRTPDKLKLGTYSFGSPKGWTEELVLVAKRLEHWYKDMVDVEFTVQDNKLYVLQSRVGKRSARAAFKIAYDLDKELLIPRQEALSRLTIEQFKVVRRPGIDPTFDKLPILTGLPACPGVAVGKPVFSSQDAVNCTEPCILVTHETTPDDIAGMAKAKGILTQTGGSTSHAAVVARAMDKPCITGATDLDLKALKANVEAGLIHKITLDGATGRVWYEFDVPVIDTSDSVEVQGILGWCLAAAGMAEQVTLALEVPVAQRIMAAHWWGDEDALEVALDGIAEHQDRSKIVLDLSEPLSFVPEEDAPLMMAFGPQPEDNFNDVLYGHLLKRKDELQGLTVVNGDLPTQQLRKLGYNVPEQPSTVADLMQPSVGEPDEQFITQIVGGQEAWKKLKAALVQAGYGMSMVPQAVPAEYAAFTVLRSIQ